MLSAIAHWWVILLVVTTTVFCIYLLISLTKNDENAPDEGELMPHSFDGIQEVNNPLPSWWTKLFWGSIVFAVAYLALYPGLGNYQGIFGMTLEDEWQAEMNKHNEEIRGLFAAMAQVPVEELANNPEYSEALDAGKSLFQNGTCALCHLATGKGVTGSGAINGYPNLTDNDWLHGGSPADIIATLTNGRKGAMPSQYEGLGKSADNVKSVSLYVKSLSDVSVAQTVKNARHIKYGEAFFKGKCAACHGTDAKGNTALGAPNLTDDIWLHGSDLTSIEHTVRYGRKNVMPSHKDLLSADQIHVLSAYVYSLSLEANQNQ